MKKQIVILSLLILSGAEFFARYNSVESDSEFHKRIDDSDFSLACIADSKSKVGKNIQDVMQDLAKTGMFAEELHERFGFLFVRAERSGNKSLVDEYGYKGKPLFIIFEGGGDKLVKSDLLSMPYTRQKIKQFIKHEVGNALDEIKEDVQEEQAARRNEDEYRSHPRVHVGFGTGYYPGYGYYRWGRPHWWHRRYRSYHPYSRGHLRRSGLGVGFSRGFRR